MIEFWATVDAYSLRDYVYSVVLPAYIARLEAAQLQPKQMELPL